jgi:hypothetical protein
MHASPGHPSKRAPLFFYDTQEEFLSEDISDFKSSNYVINGD